MILHIIPMVALPTLVEDSNKKIKARNASLGKASVNKLFKDYTWQSWDVLNNNYQIFGLKYKWSFKI